MKFNTVVDDYILVKTRYKNSHFKEIKLILMRYILRPKCDCSPSRIGCDEMVISIIFIYKRISTNFVIYVKLYVFGKNHLLLNLMRLNN